MVERVRQIRAGAEAVLVDAGNTFFSAPKLNNERAKLEFQRAKTIAKSYRAMGLAAISPGGRDFALGVEVLRGLIADSGAVAVSANLEIEDPRMKIRSAELISTPGFKILVTGLTDFEGSPPKGARVRSAEDALQTVLATASAQKPDRVIVLSHLGEKRDRELAKKFPGLFFLGARTQDFHEKPLQEGAAFLFEPGIEGQRLGEITLSKERPGFSSATLTELTDVFDSPRMK